MILFRFFLILVAGSGWLIAAGLKVEPYFSELPGYSLEKRQELDAGEGKGVGSFTAPILDEYGLRSYSVWEAKPTGGAGGTTTVEVFEVRDSTAALGLFSIWDEVQGREQGRRLDLPEDNWYQDRDLLFRRGNLVLHLERKAKSQDTEKEMTALAREIIHTVPGSQDLPVSVVHLPEEEMERESIHFYLGAASLALNKDFPKPLHKVVGMEDDIEIASAFYGPNHTPLFLIAYPTPKLASQYFLKVQTALSSHFSRQGLYVTRSGLLIGLVAGSEQDATRILSRVKYSPSVEWLDEKPDPNVSGMRFIVKAILGTLAFLLMTLAVGLLVGYLRYQVIRHYPNIGKKGEMIRLKISEP